MRFDALLLQPPQQDVDPFEVVNNFLGSPFLQLAGQLLALLVVVFWLALVYWTYTDAARRGAIKILWGLVAVLFPFLGTLIYLIVRPPEYALDAQERELELAVLERELRSRIITCPNCRSMIEKDYLVCPECSWQLKKPCENCEKPLNLEWEVCPFCGVDQRTGRKVSF